MTDEGMPDTTGGEVAPRWPMWPLYGAGFVTAFGAHRIAASLGGFIGPEHLSLPARPEPADVSHHLKVLVDAGLLTRDKRGVL